MCSVLSVLIMTLAAVLWMRHYTGQHTGRSFSYSFLDMRPVLLILILRNLFVWKEKKKKNEKGT